VRVSDAMVESVCASLKLWHESWWRDVRAALEDALAGVPDPYEQTSALVNADRSLAELEAKLEKARELATEDGAFLARGIQLLEQADARIAELEAKLQRVRAALVEHSPSKALVILDGEEVT
jgi:hypothetical protein